MAFSSPPPSLLLLLLLIASTVNAATNSFESEDMLQSLRNYGYTLFTNGISTSDLKYQLLSDSAAAAPISNFTLFAPRDELLYALDMATDAAAYVSTLRYHVVPNRRHTFSDLKNLSVPFLDTLLPHYAVLIGRVRDVDVSSDRPSIAILVDGVRVTFPDLYVGSRIAVHGIDGILLTGLNMSRDLFDGNDHLPPAGSPAPTNNNVSAPRGALSVSVAPASSQENIPSETPNPSVSTPVPSNIDGNVSAAGSPTDAAPPEKGSSSSRVDWNNVAAAPAAMTTPTPRNIPAEAAPSISPKMKRLGRKKEQKGKGHRKGRRRRHHKHGRRRDL